MVQLRAFHSRLAMASLSAMLLAAGMAHGARADQVTYVVQPSDTLSSIAQHFGTTIPALVKANNLTNADFIRAGMRLVIAGSSSGASSTTTTLPSTTGGTVYIVRWGDTLTSISQRFGVAAPTLSQTNALVQPSLIRAGQKLVIPNVVGSSVAGTAGLSEAVTGLGIASVSGATAPVTGGVVYVVQPGDSLTGLSVRFGISTQSIASQNGISANAYLTVGQQLAIPAVQSTPAETPASTITTVPQSTPQLGTYVVQSGDTLSTIGWRFGTSADALAAQNYLTTASVLQIGQHLAVPGGQEPFATKTEIESILVSEAQRAGIDPALVKAVAWQESGWQMITASDGGMGVMQLMPDSVTWSSDSLLGYTINPYNTVDNIRAGVAMLHYYLGVYPDVEHALAAYHQGMAGVDNEGILPETQRYIANILALQQQYGG